MSSIRALSPEPPVSKPDPRPEPPPPKAKDRDDEKAAQKVTAAKAPDTGQHVDIQA